MKKLLGIALLLGVGMLGRASITIDFQVGILTDASGNTPIADGRLIQIIASSDNVFAPPAPGAFIGGNDVLLFSGSFDSSTAPAPGEMDLVLTGLSAAIAHQNLLVRWFPTLLGNASTPGGSTSYGQYGSLTDVTWVAPADGGNVTISLFTDSSTFGSIPNSAGFASLTTAAIPEPSTYAAILGALALGFVAYRRRRQAA